MNNVVLIGRLTRDPELRYTQGEGIAVANFTLAVDRIGSDEADFIKCIAWRKQAETVDQYLGKGSQVAVEGRLQIRSYDDRDGNKRTAVEVVCNRVQFLDTRKKEQATQTVKDEGGYTNYAVTDEDVPF